MAHRAVTGALRARALVYAAFTAAFAALFTYVTARFVLSGGDALGIVIVAALTAGMWYQAWRWYRRSRGAQPASADGVIADPPADAPHERAPLTRRPGADS